MSPGARVPRVVIVGCGFPQLGLLRFCRAARVEIIGLDANPAAVGVAFCDRFVAASTADAEAIAKAVADESADGLTTAGSELAVLPTALAAEATGRPFYAASQTIQNSLYKHDMRARYQAGGAPSPPFAAIRSVAEAEAFADQWGLPLVIKPARGWGQRGVRVVMLPTELAAAVEDGLTAARGAMPDPCCVIEQFVDGREFSVDAYTREGKTEVLAVTERIITSYPDPPGITYAEVHPPGLSLEERASIEAAAIQGLAALAYVRGPSYTQVRLGVRGPFLLETAMRLGGGLDPEVSLLASGVSLYRRLLGVALQRCDWETSGPEAQPHGGAIGRFVIGKPGRVQSLSGLDQARQLPGIVDVQVYVKPGGLIHPLTDGAKRAGHVLAFGADRTEAENRAAHAMRSLEILTVPS